MADRTTPIKKILFYINVAGLKIVSLPICKFITGTKNIPDGPCLFAANHRSLIDGVIVVNEINRVRRKPIHMIAYQEPFAHPLFGPIMKISGCIPFDRGDEESRTGVLATALGFLREGEPVAIFPEAHLSQTDKMRRARPGMALLALESGVPVVPVGLRFTECVLEPGTGKFRLGTRAELEIGEPLTFAEDREKFLHGEKEESAEAVENVSTSVMLAIAKLSRQEYPYAGKSLLSRKRKKPSE